MVREVVLAEFNAWMQGKMEYCDMSFEAQFYADEYLVDYWEDVDSMCAVADA